MNYYALEGKFKYRGKRRGLNKVILLFALYKTVITSLSFPEINWYSSEVNLQEPQFMKTQPTSPSHKIIQIKAQFPYCSVLGWKKTCCLLH